MFFPRLRRKAKPVFVILALVFGLSFLALGVGTGVSGTSIGDILSDIFRTGGTGQPSVADAQEKVAKNPRDADAQLELASAYQAEGRMAEATTALERYVELRPRDADGLQRLASLYTRRANEARNRAAVVQAQSQTPLSGRIFAPQGPLGQALGKDRIAEALSQQAAQGVTDAIEVMQREYRKVAATYQKLILLQPEEPGNFLQLGQASQLAGESEDAIAAYKAFLKLSPDDALAPSVREQLKALEAAAPSASAG